MPGAWRVGELGFIRGSTAESYTPFG